LIWASAKCLTASATNGEQGDSQYQYNKQLIVLFCHKTNFCTAENGCNSVDEHEEIG
jgi:hypothetical protein